MQPLLTLSVARDGIQASNFQLAIFLSLLYMFIVWECSKAFHTTKWPLNLGEKKSKKTLYLTLITRESQIWAGGFCKDAMVVDPCLWSVLISIQGPFHRPSLCSRVQQNSTELPKHTTSLWEQNVNLPSHVLFPSLYRKVFHYKFNFFNRYRAS